MQEHLPLVVKLFWRPLKPPIIVIFFPLTVCVSDCAESKYEIVNPVFFRPGVKQQSINHTVYNH